MKTQRPVNLDLTTFSFPLPAIVSILHRISGAFLFLVLPYLLYLLNQSLESQQGLQSIQQTLDNLFIKLIIWAALSAFWYHLIAGIRHLLMDIGFGESLCAARWSAKGVFVLSFIFILLTGCWLW